MVINCARCGRVLKNPHSVARSLGPVCYAKSGGGVFDGDLNVDEKEWARREQLLKAGGEIDLGVNWDYPDPGNLIRRYTMRVSVRYKDGAYEAYGRIFAPGEEPKEVIFARSIDLKEVYREAVAAGPTCSAMAHRARQQAGRKARIEWRKNQRRLMKGLMVI